MSATAHCKECGCSAKPATLKGKFCGACGHPASDHILTSVFPDSGTQRTSSFAVPTSAQSTTPRNAGGSLGLPTAALASAAVIVMAVCIGAFFAGQSIGDGRSSELAQLKSNVAAKEREVRELQESIKSTNDAIEKFGNADNSEAAKRKRAADERKKVQAKIKELTTKRDRIQGRLDAANYHVGTDAIYDMD